MLIIVLLLITGVIIGLSVGKISEMLKLDERMLTLLAYLVLFMFAISTGIDEKILRSLDMIGWFEFIIIIGAVTMSVLIFWYLTKLLPKKFIRKLFAES